MTHFVPGTVTPAQLEQYRRQYEAARAKEQHAWALMKQLCHYHGEMMAAYEESGLAYALAQRGMVREVEA